MNRPHPHNPHTGTHPTPPGPAGNDANAPRTLKAWITDAAKQLEEAGICLANGLQEPYPEAEYLVCHALGVPFETAGEQENSRVPTASEAAIRTVLTQRIQKRRPAAYITGEAFFAGLRLQVDSRTLIPRSRIENLFDDDEGFDALLEPNRVSHILDLGTGSGCLAIALAMAFPRAQVDGTDVSTEALAVAAINQRHFRLEKQIRLIRSNLFTNLAGSHYDLIVANPPYVDRATLAALPPEYQHEPRLALDGGDDGLRLVTPILYQAPRYLNPGGVLVCEVGDPAETTMKQRWPDLPVEWLYFHFGASGVFTVRREPLAQWVNRHPEK